MLSASFIHTVHARAIHTVHATAVHTVRDRAVYTVHARADRHTSKVTNRMKLTNKQNDPLELSVVKPTWDLN